MTDWGVNFSGTVHDHRWSSTDDKEKSKESKVNAKTCPTIAILKRHPMYDCLILVKKFRKCLNGYALEFPIVESQDLGEEDLDDEKLDDNDHTDTGIDRQDENKDFCRRKMVSRYLDGDDPWKFGPIIDTTQNCSSSSDDNHDPVTMSHDHHSSESVIRPCRLQFNLRNHNPNEVSCPFINKSYPPQLDDLGQICELVTVPINGLLDRLQLQTDSGVSVDSKVYAFAMGLKTAERILTRNNMHEISETPPI